MAGLIDESGRRRTGKCAASCQDQRQNKTAQTLGHISILFNPSLPSRCRSHRQEMELPLVDLAFSYYIFGGTSTNGRHGEDGESFRRYSHLIDWISRYNEDYL